MAEATCTVDTCRAIWRRLRDGSPAVITAHLRLDADGAGSVLALRHALILLGVEVHHIFPGPTPTMFDFLPGMQEISRADELPSRYNLIVVDCGTPERVGELSEVLTGAVCTVNIDHHPTNDGFGDLNLVDAQASSCGEMIGSLLEAGGVRMTPEIAECLLAAIVGDTGQFSHGDTTPHSLEVAAQCIRAGARPAVIAAHLFASLTPAQVRLKHLVLGSLQLHADGRIATMEVTREMLERTGLEPVDSEGFADLPANIQGVRASALFRELPEDGCIKVSMRSRSAADVCAAASQFGGGGHVQASGCEIRDTLDNARRAVVRVLKEQLARATGVRDLADTAPRESHE